MRRAVESALIFLQTYSSHDRLNLKVDERLREIDYDIYTEKRNHPAMKQIANQQKLGDYEVRFGNGENKGDIIKRFFNFLSEIYLEYSDCNVVIFSHGRAISIVVNELKQICNIAMEDMEVNNYPVRIL